MTLELYINKCWKDFLKKKSLSVVCNPSIPILWFGNYDEYVSSEKKILTVGLNPSSMEFKEKRSSTVFDVNIRFPAASTLVNKSVLTQQKIDLYKRAMNEYFSIGTDYWTWFESFENILSAFNASYKLANIHRAIHVDIYTPIATNPTWGGLKKAHAKDKQALLQNTEYNFEDFVDYLNPDIIIVSANADVVYNTFCNSQNQPCTKINSDACLPQFEKPYYPYIRGYHLDNNRILIWVKNCRGKPLRGMNKTDINYRIQQIMNQLTP